MTTCSAQSDQPATAFERIGGEPGIAAFVNRFYEIMEASPEAAAIWKWHRADMDDVRARLVAFLTGWFGGADAYRDHYGAPMMRRKHMAFPIGPAERDIWLACARAALAETVPDQALRTAIDQALTGMAERMRNLDANGQPDGTECCGNCG
jgi:hemoglobin